MSKKSAGLVFVKLLFLFILLSCNKKSSSSPNNNEVKATVVFSNGTTLNINATGNKALLGCGSMGGGTHVDGINESNAGVLISVYLNSTMCVSKAGTYSGMNFGCQYRTDVYSGSSPIYTNNNNGAINGSITFVAIDASHMEGYFNAVCYMNSDSVMVNGTFKGDHLD